MSHEISTTIGIIMGFVDILDSINLSDEEKKAFILDRQGAIAGRKLANQYGWKIGDQIPLRGTIYPGTWVFTLRGIWDGKETKTDESQLLFQWKYLSESIRKRSPNNANFVGAYVVGINEPGNAPIISERIDKQFKNSLAETLTETEKAFQLSFVSMSEAILVAVNAVSFLIIIIIQ